MRWVVGEEESSILGSIYMQMMQKRLKIIVWSPSCRKRQHAESTAQSRLLHKGSTLHIWILGMAPKLRLLWAKPSAKLKEDKLWKHRARASNKEVI